MQQAVRHLRTRCCAHFSYHGQSVLWQRTYSSETKTGVIGSMRKAYDTAAQSREDQSKEKIFQTQLKYLSSPTPVTPQVFLKLLDEVKVVAGLGGVKKHLPWVANNEAMKDFEQQEAIIKALTPAEQQSFRPLKIAGKKRVSRATGADLLVVESLLSQISTMRSVQKYLLRRVERGEKLPESPEQMKLMMTTTNGGGRVKMPRPGVKQKRSI